MLKPYRRLSTVKVRKQIPSAAQRSRRKKVAIACQGGGSHTAFTAGVLSYMLRQDLDVDIIGLSGTSGGAICAALAWYGLLRGDPKQGAAKLEGFWKANSVQDPWQIWLNDSLVQSMRLRRYVSLPEYNPNFLPMDLGRNMLRDIIARFIDLDDVKAQLSPQSPHLHIGAVDVLTGDFKIFSEQEFSITMLLASAAIPNLFKAVEIDGHFYWDGLFSHNPPVLSLAALHPDEIWVIQINPKARQILPFSIDDMADRRNELTGNLSLEQDISFINKINQYVDRGILQGGHNHIDVKRIALQRELDYPSKLERRPSFIRGLMAYGEAQAAAFLADESAPAVAAD